MQAGSGFREIAGRLQAASAAAGEARRSAFGRRVRAFTRGETSLELHCGVGILDHAQAADAQAVFGLEG
jgi:hypothetical protein